MLIKTRIVTTIVLLGLLLLIVYIITQSQIQNQQHKYSKNQEATDKIRDPYKYFLKIQERCNKLHDYKCIFERQERIDDVILKEQTYSVRFRTWPFSVYMNNIKNPSGAKEILYIEKNLVIDGKEHMLVVPSGSIVKLFFPVTRIAINDPKVLTKSRNTIDRFGFANIINRIMKELISIDFLNYGVVGSRQTRIYLCALKQDIEAYVHIDKEREIPISVRIFDKKGFLGYYSFMEVELNVGLQDSDFSL